MIALQHRNSNKQALLPRNSTQHTHLHDQTRLYFIFGVIGLENDSVSDDYGCIFLNVIGGVDILNLTPAAQNPGY